MYWVRLVAKFQNSDFKVVDIGMWSDGVIEIDCVVVLRF